MEKLRGFLFHVLISFNVGWTLGLHGSKGDIGFSLLTGFISLGAWLLFVLLNKEYFDD